jgi:hypothetical protein
MPQEYTVLKAFQATVSKEDKTPKSFTNGAGQTLFVWKAQLANIPGWVNINKQAGNEVREGDTLYGTVTPNQWNTGYDFKGAQRPQEAPLTPPTLNIVSVAAQTPGAQSTSVTADDKLDYIIGMLEELRGEQRTVESIFPSNPVAAAPAPVNQLGSLDI